VPKRITKGNLWGFIQSRPYASVADMRRLFTMDVDGAAIMPTAEGTYFIGLPQDAADLIGQLWHEGRIVLDTNPDVKALVVQGVYPARVMTGRQSTTPGGQQNGRAHAPRPPRAPAAPTQANAVVDAIDAEEGDDSEPDADVPVLQEAGAGTERSGKRRRRRRKRSGKGEFAAGANGTAAQGEADGATPMESAGPAAPVVVG
jgi:hypothetical protein